MKEFMCYWNPDRYILDTFPNPSLCNETDIITENGYMEEECEKILQLKISETIYIDDDHIITRVQ